MPVRRAFLMGQEHYNNGFGTLECCKNDVEEVARVLRKCAFENPFRMFDFKKSDFDCLKERFLPQNVEGGHDGDPAIFLVYYSGHGVNVDAQTYLVPVDARPHDPGSWFSLNSLVQPVHDLCCEQNRRLNESTAEAHSARPAPGTLILIILDCCRNNPGEMLNIPVRFEEMTQARDGTTVDTRIAYLYACDLGQTAGEGNRHGFFTRALVETIEACPGQHFMELLHECDARMRGSGQRLWLSGTGSTELHKVVLYPLPTGAGHPSASSNGSPFADRGASQAPLIPTGEDPEPEPSLSGGKLAERQCEELLCHALSLIAASFTFAGAGVAMFHKTSPDMPSGFPFLCFAVILSLVALVAQLAFVIIDKKVCKCWVCPVTTVDCSHLLIGCFDCLDFKESLTEVLFYLSIPVFASHTFILLGILICTCSSKQISNSHQQPTDQLDYDPVPTSSGA